MPRRAASPNEPGFEAISNGFYEVQPGGWRWAGPQFSVSLDGPDLPDAPAVLELELFVPRPTIEKFGSITVTATVGSHELAAETYSRPGQHTFSYHVPANWMKSGSNRFEFKVDKHLGPTVDDSRELGVVVSGASLAPE